MQFLKKDVLTSDIKPELLESFERWLRDNNVCQNSISCYMRSLRSLMSKIYGDYSNWASVAYSSNVDLPVISKALGHSNPQTTLTYIKEIDDNRLDDANHSIVSRII